MIAFLVLLLVFGSAPDQGLNSLARATLDQGLAAQGISEEELGFYKQWATDSFFRLEAVNHLLDNPLEVAAYTDDAAERVGKLDKSPAGLFLNQWRETDAGVGSKDSARIWQEMAKELKNVMPRVSPDSGPELPASIQQAVALVLAGFRVGERYMEQVVAGLSRSERNKLLGEAPSFWQEEDPAEKTATGALQREFGLPYDTTWEVKAETVLAYARKLERKALALSGLAVTLAAIEAQRVLAASPPSFPETAELDDVEGVTGEVFLARESRWGLVVVGGDGDNSYHRDCCLLIDAGGNDDYFNRAGGAVGFLDNHFSVLIDLAGNDRYHTDRLFGQGSALFGTGVLIDAAGDDVYRAGSYSQGTGIFGTGLLWDKAGEDIYDAGLCAQGAGHFGCGLLSDAGGNDAYRSQGYCQGFASTWGYGLLADYSGNDGYYAGGRYLHEPLLPHEYRSFSQGFATGWRPDASGGIGFLCDRAGNDFYDAEVYAQGTSYWYSLGMLWDGSGYDHYTAAQYSQGSGIHLSVGCLVDNEGNDSYYSRLGPSQGEGHDLSVGVLLDRKGNDVYHASGGEGVALTNSVGMFVDVTGNDVYSSTEAVALGGGTASRGFASIGSFMDLAGRDRFTAGSAGSDNASWTNGIYGWGSDTGNEPVQGDEAEEGDTLEISRVDTLALPVDSLFEIASTWEVGNARARVRQARRQLQALGRQAFEYVFREKADTKSGLEARAVEDLVKALPDTAKPFLYRALNDERYLARNNAAYWLGKMGEDAEDAVDSILLALKQDRISPRRAASALGDIGNSLVVPQILYLLKDSFEPSRIVCAEACGKLKNPVAIPSLVQNLDDHLFTVRSAAEMALVAIGEPALDSLLGVLGRLQPPALGHAVRACADVAAELDSTGAEKKEETREALLPFLRYENVFVRLVAVQGTGKLADKATRKELTAAKKEETNQFVLAAYKKALAGK